MDRVTCKYANWTRGQTEALINIIGEDNAKALLAGDLTVSFEKAVKTLFDKNGRRIPKDLQAAVCDPNRSFRLEQPQITKEVHYVNRILRLHGNLGIDTGITAEQFQQEAGRLLAKIRENPQIANITNGVCLPVILPKLVETEDLGAVLEKYLEAVSKSYINIFPNRKFYNYREGKLTGRVSIVKGTRHDNLIEKMRQGPVIAIHFPNPLQGFSMNASREQMATLPEGFVLSGLDTVIAMAMYPDVLARDYNTPGLDLAALACQSPDCSLVFAAGDDGLSFVGRADLGDANDVSSSGLLFPGSA